ncbi:hypothetical protein I552_3018 [Mycobacterium xenopi 3993]|nr:hypothetical protein I552_3018 [Mycobacterium xenopi 3993]
MPPVKRSCAWGDLGWSRGLIHLATRGARPAGTELDRPTLRRNGIDAMIGPLSPVSGLAIRNA